ncbi:3-oxoacyl-ACP synthase [Burkholderia singularis]|uniref:3-oxoacyl-ACP synthase n=1 Tax=Burkholderia singularis TaxID=1503053 RepID=A0A103DZW9_9BURK|nr:MULTISPECIES: 3-oxoacyl-ACP synthase [Burkholderia]AOK32248.1 3-oxoacyl-ACP synthase [Burkholderia sp. Bp7605]KVE25775.1 3-oxoacyl-ACP synthase [Burkholderia singularis]
MTTTPTPVTGREDFWIGIDAAAYELPGPPVDIEAWAAERDYPAQRAAAIARSGSRYFHMALDTSETDLAIAAAGRLLDVARVSPADVGAIVHVHTQPFSVPPAPRSLPHELAAHCGIEPLWLGSIAQLNCVSVAAGIETVRALMRRHAQLDAALIVSSDRVYGEDFRMRQMTGVQCDGAAAMLLVRNSTATRLGAIAIETHAKWYRGSDTVAENEADLIAMEWPYTRKAIDAALALEPHPLDDYALVLPHNADLPGWRALCRAMRVPPERLYEANIHARGHACCSDFPINLADVGLDAVAKGQRVLGVMQSNCGAYAAATLHPVTRHDA